MEQARATLPTFTIRISMAGDLETAKRWLRQECWREGLCVTIEPTTFIYSGGEESGFVVGLLNYPRFPKEPSAIGERALRIAEALMEECAQRTSLVVASDQTVLVTRELPK